jgi:hypothetical protein
MQSAIPRTSLLRTIATTAPWGRPRTVHTEPQFRDLVAIACASASSAAMLDAVASWPILPSSGAVLMVEAGRLTGAQGESEGSPAQAGGVPDADRITCTCDVAG